MKRTFTCFTDQVNTTGIPSCLSSPADSITNSITKYCEVQQFKVKRTVAGTFH